MPLSLFIENAEGPHDNEFPLYHIFTPVAMKCAF